MASKKVAVEVDGHRMEVSNLDKVLYPEDGTTKRDVIEHYLRVSDAILPQLADRPVTRKRWPDGVASTPFFEKNVPRGTPEWVRRVELDSPGSTKQRDTVVYPFIEDRRGLVWAANLAALELHTPQWTVGPRGGVHGADRVVVDLDPGTGAGLAECAEVARLVRERFEDEGLDCVPVTSGSKGIQVYGRLDDELSSDRTRGWAKKLAVELEKAHPDLIVSSMAKTERTGKVLIDWSQNTAAKTTITPYSLRGRAYANVAMPRTWDELDDAGLVQVHRTEVQDRLDDLGDLLA